MGACATNAGVISTFVRVNPGMIALSCHFYTLVLSKMHACMYVKRLRV
jgi:hypothetical protein